MHELSLVQSIFTSLESEVDAPDLESLSQVDLKIGLLANVEPILLQSAFTAFQESHPQYADVALEIETVPVMIHCSHCDADSPVEQYVFRCQTCGKPSDEIVSGEELLIQRIHFSDS